MSKILVAVGGNSLVRTGQRGTIEEQTENVRETAARIADIAVLGHDLIITHGNGPQVGAQLLRSEAGSSQTYTQPLDVCVAATQGEMGYILQNALQSELRSRGLRVPVVTIVTQVLVNSDDPAFNHPTKPIGPFYHEEDARRKVDELGWEIVEDASRGYRRVVPSPMPAGILELDAIRMCVEEKIIVIAVGGGGVPVIEKDLHITGIEAVVDKDRSSALLAAEIGASVMLISTDVECVYLDYRKPGQRPLPELTDDEAAAILRSDEFAPGSMRPKIEASLYFIRHGGEEAIITDPLHLAASLSGKIGTHIKKSTRG